MNEFNMKDYSGFLSKMSCIMTNIQQLYKESETVLDSIESGADFTGTVTEQDISAIRKKTVLQKAVTDCRTQLKTLERYASSDAYQKLANEICYLEGVQQGNISEIRKLFQELSDKTAGSSAVTAIRNASGNGGFGTHSGSYAIAKLKELLEKNSENDSSGKLLLLLNALENAMDSGLLDKLTLYGLFAGFPLAWFTVLDVNGVIPATIEALTRAISEITEQMKKQAEEQERIAEQLAGQHVEVPLDGQDTNYTCGSASGSMILNSLGYETTEAEFWNYANANGEGTYVYRVVQTLNHFAGSEIYHYTETNGMSLDTYYQTIKNSIADGYPVQVVGTFSSDSAFGYNTGGHYFVITGVRQNPDGEYIALVNDPFSPNWSENGHQGQQIEVPLSDIKNYNLRHSDSGYIICH